MNKSRRILAELEERVERIFSAIEDLRDSAADGRARRKLIDAIFREVHSLKASAATSGLEQLAHISHDFENLLHALRVGRKTLDDDLLSVFDESAEALFSSLDPEQEHPVASSLAQRTRRVDGNSRREPAEVEIALSALPGDMLKALSDQEKHQLQESIGEGASLYLLNTNFPISKFDEQFQSLITSLSAKGEVISTAPRIDPNNPEKIDFRILYAREAELEEIKHDLRLMESVSITEVLESSDSHTSSSHDGPSVISREQGLTDSDHTSTAARTIQIKLEDLDRIISSTYQLFRETSRRLTGASEGLLRVPEFQVLTDSVDESFLSLGAQLVDLRMVSVERVLHRALRSGRRLAHSSGKEIDFHVSGSTLLLDKSLCDSIADPLIHLVRNAVDHGIESGSEREGRGKERRGCIRIEAASIQGQTRISVSDDGRGIEPDSVSRVAKEFGLIDDQMQLNMDQSVRILFRSGFSTATEVSSSSGRGVGLDVVETAVEDLGGEIRVSSIGGVGSVFEMRLPVTFGLLQALIVKSGGQPYLLEQNQVALTMALVEKQDGASSRVGNELLPKHHLVELLGRIKPHSNNSPGDNAVVCKLKKELPDGSIYSDKVVLVVDEILGNQKVLVRNLGSRGSRWFGVSGAAELRDGRVALLLDLPRLISSVRA